MSKKPEKIFILNLGLYHFVGLHIVFMHFYASKVRVRKIHMLNNFCLWSFILFEWREEKKIYIILFVVSCFRLLIRTSHIAVIRLGTKHLLHGDIDTVMICFVALCCPFLSFAAHFLCPTLSLSLIHLCVVFHRVNQTTLIIGSRFIFKCAHISMICINRKCGIRIILFCLTLI